jgi:hypothetical protein
MRVDRHEVHDQTAGKGLFQNPVGSKVSNYRDNRRCNVAPQLASKGKCPEHDDAEQSLQP